ncbi:MAG: hypothetical protein ABIR68_18570 [Ilumatobacteraceae bacterium]
MTGFFAPALVERSFFAAAFPAGGVATADVADAFADLAFAALAFPVEAFVAADAFADLAFPVEAFVAADAFADLAFAVEAFVAADAFAALAFAGIGASVAPGIFADAAVADVLVADALERARVVAFFAGANITSSAAVAAAVPTPMRLAVGTRPARAASSSS